MNGARECSPLFLDVIGDSRAGSFCITCSCGRAHFTVADADYEPGELDRLISRAAVDPDRYMQHSTWISSIEVLGRLWVDGCPCNWGPNIEQLLRSDPLRIVRYLRALAEVRREHAEDVLGEIGEAGES